MNRKLFRLGLAALVAFLAVVSGCVAHAPAETASYVPGQVLVRFREGTSESIQTEVHGRHGGTVLDIIPEIGVQVVRISSDSVEETVRDYQMEEPDVEFAEPDYLTEAAFTPNDPMLDKQWGLVKIQAPQAWDIARGSAAVKIAILDTGIDNEHEDLAMKVVADISFTENATSPDTFGHGTHVAGIAAAMTNNGIGVAGADMNSALMSVKVLGDDGDGSESSIARGIVWAANNGARVISMSLGSPEASVTVENAVNFAWSKGSVIIASAGNSNTTQPHYPAFFEKVIAVAATDRADSRASFSNFGSWVDIAAPGVNIFSTLPHEQSFIGDNLGVQNYGSLRGTSMAAPFVSGVAALIISQHPTWTNAQVRSKLEASIDPANGFTTSIGRINALKAVSQ